LANLHKSGLQSYICTVSAKAYAADLNALQDEMSTIQKSRHQDVVRFRSDVAATITRCVQLGVASAPHSRLLMKLYATLGTECDAWEAVDGVNERIRKVGGEIGALGPGNTRGEESVMAVVGMLGELSMLQAEKERRQRELEKLGGKRAQIEEELKGGSCHCQAKMCGKCMELLRQCEDCEELGRAWEKMARK
jgi:hypothetical protein